MLPFKNLSKVQDKKEYVNFLFSQKTSIHASLYSRDHGRARTYKSSDPRLKPSNLANSFLWPSSHFHAHTHHLYSKLGTGIQKSLKRLCLREWGTSRGLEKGGSGRRINFFTQQWSSQFEPSSHPTLYYYSIVRHHQTNLILVLLTALNLFRKVV